MIIIYSADSAGRLFTDPKRRAYVDADLLREKATAVKTAAVLDRIARLLGFDSFQAMDCYTRCCGVTQPVLMDLIITGKIADALRRLPN